ncbi:carbohydrate-binding-like protein [Fomitopsis serialis]|uniref:carbohydrate-binding-like protein n=1 Tax=Fomitopsis serialis TaxID=139415 RepID=UPI002007EC85|nr:carbohydrate-binding-like protein [Neoantrodia serialis]KAH9922375.1 carbohydrate-binding-like protein [Neoantrodia serialis]
MLTFLLLVVENLYITGSVAALENWSTDDALLLSSANYPTWSLTVNLPPSTTIEYKYLTKNNGDVTWEDDPNSNLTTPASGSVTQSDSWH